MSTNFAHENIAYWTKRAPSYSQVNQEELKTGQRAVWKDTLDSRNFYAVNPSFDR